MARRAVLVGTSRESDDFLGDLRLKKGVVRWTDEEWDELARRVHRRRGRHPDENLWTLLNAVQEQQPNRELGLEAWPQDRKRRVQGMSQARPVVSRLRLIDMGIREEIERDIPSLRATIETLRQRPDKEAVLAGLCEEEVLRRFTEPVLKQLSPADLLARFKTDELLSSLPIAEIFAFVGQMMFGELSAMQLQLARHLQEHQHATNGHNGNGHKTNGHKVNGMPTIAFVGMQQHQHSILSGHFAHRAHLIFVPKTSRGAECDFPTADTTVVWEPHVPGAQKTEAKKRLPHDKLMSHRGTLNQLIDRMEELPCLKKKSK